MFSKSLVIVGYKDAWVEKMTDELRQIFPSPQKFDESEDKYVFTTPFGLEANYYSSVHWDKVHYQFLELVLPFSDPKRKFCFFRQFLRTLDASG